MNFYEETCCVCGECFDATVDGGETDDNGYYTCSDCEYQAELRDEYYSDED